MVDRDTNAILRRLVDQWQRVQAELPRLNQAAEVRPADGFAVLRPSTSSPDIASFELLPVVFNLPERAKHPSADLFVVIQGLLSFRRAAFVEEGVLLTDTFATQVAYFRRTTHALEHVFGAHYDFALDELGHPAFHAQMRSFVQLSERVMTEYGFASEVTDHVKGLLRTVRVPIAQMDVFSLFVQVCADHLLYKSSGAEQRAAFNSLLDHGKFVRGAGFQMPRLATEDARTCYRARHWYPSIN